jgi:hypothetical protein
MATRGSPLAVDGVVLVTVDGMGGGWGQRERWWWERWWERWWWEAVLKVLLMHCKTNPYPKLRKSRKGINL